MSASPPPLPDIDLQGDATEGLPEVDQHDIESALGVNSVPDQVRTTSDDPDETNSTIDSTGQLTPPAEQEPEGVRPQD